LHTTSNYKYIILIKNNNYEKIYLNAFDPIWIKC